jgi:hypothetical protein
LRFYRGHCVFSDTLRCRESAFFYRQPVPAGTDADIFNPAGEILPWWSVFSGIFLTDRRNIMPNWCHNRVTICADHTADFADLKTLVGSVDHPFDFQKIKPMPESLNIEAGSCEIGYRAMYGDYQGLLNYPWISRYHVKTREQLVNLLNRIHPEYLEKADLYKKNRDEYGHLNWYSWRLANWGTKWAVPAEDIHIMDETEDFMELEFDTAWSPADGIHQAVIDLIDQHNLSASISWFYDEPGMAMAGYL